jgi:Transglycosylase SLT domain
MTGVFRLLVLLLAIVYCLTAYAQIPLAYKKVAGVKKIPAELLYAIAATESLYGYTDAVSNKTIYGPWPWSLNINRRGVRFDHRVEAYQALIAAIAQHLSVDVGLTQISWRWHQQRFESPWTALDPYTNLMVGADILFEQYQKTGDWWVAVGDYHAPGNDKASLQRAEKYRQRVRKHWLSVTQTSLD